MRIPLLLSACLAAMAAESAGDGDYPKRIAELEAQIRSLVEAQATESGPAGAAASPDYAAAKAGAIEAVRRRLEAAEYHLAAGDLPRAVDACNAILADHPHEPATVRLKYRILNAMVERERAVLERERSYRAQEALAGVQRQGGQPPEKPAIARTVLVFDEDVAEDDRRQVRRRLQERITLNYDGVAVGEVLKPLFAVAGINYVILDRALSTDTLTIHLVDDTVENALLTIAKLVNVRYNYSANTVFIGAADSAVTVTEIIRLRSGLTDVLAQPDLPQPAGGASGVGGLTGAAGQPQPAVQPASQQQGGQLASDLERFLQKVPELIPDWTPAAGGGIPGMPAIPAMPAIQPGGGGGGSVVALAPGLYLDRKSNTLYARSSPAAIAELKRLLAALDYHSAQVLIEARFVEVGERAARELGIDWAGGGTARDALAVSGPTSGLGLPSLNGPAATAGGAAVGSTNFLAQILYNPSSTLGIKATLRALEEQRQAESLAEPRILTLNNAVGQIQLLETVSFIENYQTQSYTTSATSNNNSTITANNVVATPVWRSVQVGYTLRIRPSIARNSDTITLELQPSVTQPTGQAQEDTFVYQPAAGDEQIEKRISRPEFSTRSLATTLHVQNGQTVVLGGLTTEVTSQGDNGVPGLRTLPVLGRLFSSSNRSSQRSHLMIFVTASIIDPSGAKIGEEVRRLRDTASVVMPEEVRLAEAELRAAEAQRAADARAAAERAAQAAEQAKPRTPSTTRPGRTP